MRVVETFIDIHDVGSIVYRDAYDRIDSVLAIVTIDTVVAIPVLSLVSSLLVYVLVVVSYNELLVTETDILIS